MRVLAVFCLVFAFVAAQEDEGADTTAPKTIFGCVLETLNAFVKASEGNSKEYLQTVVPQGDIDSVLSRVEAEYERLRQNLDATAKTVLANRDVCEGDNNQNASKEECDFLATMSFLPDAARSLAALIERCISIITNARLNISDAGATLVIQFLRYQNIAVVNAMRDGMICIQSRG